MKQNVKQGSNRKNQKTKMKGERGQEGLISCQFPYYNQKNSSNFGEQVIQSMFCNNLIYNCNKGSWG